MLQYLRPDQAGCFLGNIGIHDSRRCCLESICHGLKVIDSDTDPALVGTDSGTLGAELTKLLLHQLQGPFCINLGL